MIAGFAATVLIAYNGIIDKPAPEPGRVRDRASTTATGSRCSRAIAIAVVGFTRSIESGPRKTRKAPGTV